MLLRLYVVGNSPKSLQARRNLEIIRTNHFGDDCQVEVIDVLDQPLRMLADGIPATPALVKVSPPPVVKLLGDLSDHNKVILTLRS